VPTENPESAEKSRVLGWATVGAPQNLILTNIGAKGGLNVSQRRPAASLFCILFATARDLFPPDTFWPKGFPQIRF